MAESIFFAPPRIVTAKTQSLKPLSLANFKRSNSLKIVNASLFDYPLASKIVIRNLPYTTSESRLLKEFSRFGQIADVKLVKDEATKRSKGYAFIQYTSQEDALLALDGMDHQYLDGRIIFVELAKMRINDFGGYPKTSGPPEVQHLPSQDEDQNEDATSTNL